MDDLKEGVILRGIGGFYTVDVAGQNITCRARGRFRHENMVPLPGDRVEIALLSDGSGRIDNILNRRNVFSRPAVANIDRLVIIASQAPPETDPLMIDSMTAVASLKGIQTIICINKCDIDPADKLFDIYSRSGFTVFRASAETGDGIEALIKELNGKVCAFTGNSGVGKSSLLNRMEPGFSLNVGEISSKLGRGKHTTRHVELFKLSCGAVIADTPGFSAFDCILPENVGREELQFAFLEFAPFIGKCRFVGCSHIKDSGCAVREAVSAGLIEQSRYQSYVRLYQESEKTGPEKRAR